MAGEDLRFGVMFPVAKLEIQTTPTNKLMQEKICAIEAQEHLAATSPNEAVVAPRSSTVPGFAEAHQRRLLFKNFKII